MIIYFRKESCPRDVCIDEFYANLRGVYLEGTLFIKMVIIHYHLKYSGAGGDVVEELIGFLTNA